MTILNRKEFEAWAATTFEGDFRADATGNYYDHEINGAYIGWQAARAQLHRRPFTNDEIQAVVTNAVRSGNLLWAGFSPDSDGEYTIPVLSPSDFKFARAIEAAL